MHSTVEWNQDLQQKKIIIDFIMHCVFSNPLKCGNVREGDGKKSVA